MNEELQGALQGMMLAMGAACEMSGFLFQQLLKNGFTREEALPIVEKYLFGMITTDRLKGGEGNS